MEKKLEAGTRVKFKAITITGKEIPMTGEVIGFADEVRKLWTTEFAEMPEDEEIYVILVRGNIQDYRYVATPNEIVEVLA